jgi:alanine-glyoxylate transaminase/serine-glyoxylate transaminase/serine-pyruvate transaminase
MIRKSLLMIPGPIEFDPEVLTELGKPTVSHVAPDFIEIFGKTIEQMRDLFQSRDGQPFLVAGSGTLAMDLAGANLTEPGDRALVVNTGYFGDRFGDILDRYGAEVKHIRGEIGNIPDIHEVEQALIHSSYKLMTITHVDTSTGVLNKVQECAALGRKYNVLVIVDGVCSLAAEELQMSEWGIDVAFTASQKAVGVPPGLALLVAGPRAMQAFHQRKTPVANYYADWHNWIPVMQAYEARKAAYFGTPAVNLVRALHISLNQILEEGLAARTARHRRISKVFKSAIQALDLEQVPQNDDIAAATMTAPYYPQGFQPAEFLSRVSAEGVVLAGGLHPEIKTKYFRIGHMGSVNISDVITTIAAIESGLALSGYKFEPGIGLSAAMQTYLQS